MKHTAALKKELLEGRLDNTLSQIYRADSEELKEQTGRYLAAIQSYEQIFGEGEAELFSAPGRTEIGGNHTDHQNGMVLAAAIHLDLIAVAGVNEENSIQICSEGYSPVTIDLNHITMETEEQGTTAALVKGVAAGFRQRGYAVGPFKAYITSNVLNGAGLSSSAAFETLIGTILSGLYHNMQIPPVEIAMIGRYAENVYFGKPCGLMDQMACASGGLIHIDFMEPEKPVVQQIAYHPESSGYSLCIVDTKGSHADLTPDYAAIPAEMKAAAGCFDKDVLTQVPEADFFANIPYIRSQVGDRAVLRAIHFYGETKRAALEAEALQQNHFDVFLKHFAASANSSFQYLQNAYSSSDLTNQAVPVALALSQHFLGDQGVCRIHGGGFAGTIQAFVKTDYVASYKAQIEQIMGKDSCHILRIRDYGGIRVQ